MDEAAGMPPPAQCQPVLGAEQGSLRAQPEVAHGGHPAGL